MVAAHVDDDPFLGIDGGIKEKGFVFAGEIDYGRIRYLRRSYYVRIFVVS